MSAWSVITRRAPSGQCRDARAYGHTDMHGMSALPPLHPPALPLLARRAAVRASTDSLGELSGNRFAVVIRGANVPAARVEVSLREACSTGFVNFFGTQRVGAPSASARGQPLPYQARGGCGGGMRLFVARALCLNIVFCSLEKGYVYIYHGNVYPTWGPIKPVVRAIAVSLQ